MNRQDFSKLMVGAAVAGMISGTALMAQDKPADKPAETKKAKTEKATKKDSCKGKDGCKGKDSKMEKKKDSCKGKDGCKGNAA